MCCYRFLQECLLVSSGVIERQKYREGVNRMEGTESSWELHIVAL